MSTKRRKRHTPEEVVRKLRDADAMLCAGKDQAAVLQALEVSEAPLGRCDPTEPFTVPYKPPERERLIRSVNFPVQLSSVLDAEKEKQGVTNRGLVDKALDEHLDDVVKLCAEAGFAKQEGNRKLVRLSMTIEKDENL